MSIQKAIEKAFMDFPSKYFSSFQSMADHCTPSSHKLFAYGPESGNLPMVEMGDVPANDEWFKEAWNHSLPKLKKAIHIKEKLVTASEDVFLFKDRNAFKQDFNKIMDGLSVVLSARCLDVAQKELVSLKNKIKKQKMKSSHYRELCAGAPRIHFIRTTQSQYKNKIAASELLVDKAEGRISEIKDGFAREINQYGFTLSTEQVDVLLTRVDSDAIIRMTSVFDTVKAISEKLMELTDQSGENLEIAKKYYKMHVVLLELIIYMQNKYLDEMDKVYLPKLQDILDRVGQVQQKAMLEIKQEKSVDRRKIYRSNIKAHQLTLKTARLYHKSLESQRAKIIKAKKATERDLALANNTLDTVMVNADFMDLIQTSRKTFDSIINLNVPSLIPFKNKEIQRKFEEISTMISPGANV
ncbi:MAG: hypothetical protein HQL52_04725 [Magnetococcales bacterium]|nr:hypothetical protein [Magnetococcales bacterium]